jgi:hypothetical protein
MIVAGKTIDLEAGPEPLGGWRSKVPTRRCAGASTATIRAPRDDASGRES